MKLILFRSESVGTTMWVCEDVENRVFIGSNGGYWMYLHDMRDYPINGRIKATSQCGQCKSPSESSRAGFNQDLAKLLSCNYKLWQSGALALLDTSNRRRSIRTLFIEDFPASSFANNVYSGAFPRKSRQLECAHVFPVRFKRHSMTTSQKIG